LKRRDFYSKGSVLIFFLFCRYFFSDFSTSGIDDKTLVLLQNHPNAIVSSHQAFLTHEALDAISSTTYLNLLEYFEQNKKGSQMTNTVL
jgi:lactate dehydrogenase-like 2-hydroxyacid dehydrogenase